MEQFIISQPVLRAMIFSMQEDADYSEDTDLQYEPGLSDCCGEPVYAGLHVCSQCKQACEIVEE